MPHLPNLHINAQETETEFVVSRVPIKNKTAITLPQRSKEEDAFCQSILLIDNKSDDIKAEIIIRSDDFNDGAIIKELTFEIKNIR